MRCSMASSRNLLALAARFAELFLGYAQQLAEFLEGWFLANVLEAVTSVHDKSLAIVQSLAAFRRNGRSDSRRLHCVRDVLRYLVPEPARRRCPWRNANGRGGAAGSIERPLD